jgi:hypothetical protein
MAYEFSENVRRVVEELVRTPAHERFIKERVHLELVFTSKESKSNLKGCDVKVFKNLPAFLAGKPKTQQFFDPLTFVCPLCLNWHEEAERNALEVGDKTLSVCNKDFNIIKDQDLDDTTARARIMTKLAQAEKLEKHGPPDNPGLFVLTFEKAAWERWSPEKRRARVDHCLTRCVINKDVKKGGLKLSLRKYDIQEYAEVYERNGLYQDEFGKRIEKAAIDHRQATLFDQAEQSEEEDEDTGPSVWSNTVPYNIGDVVLDSEGRRYCSVSSNNLGFDPFTNTTYWRLEEEQQPGVDEEEKASPDRPQLSVVEGANRRTRQPKGEAQAA